MEGRPRLDRMLIVGGHGRAKVTFVRPLPLEVPIMRSIILSTLSHAFELGVFAAAAAALAIGMMHLK